MATRKEFCDVMLQVYNEHGVYIGTGNGERTESLTIGQIHQMEMNYGRRSSSGSPLWNSDTRRDLAYIGNCYDKGLDMSKSRAGDCSGIIYYVLKTLKVLDHDMRARDFQKKSTPVQLANLIPGDLVFDKKTEATHIGVYVSSGKVIDSRGRDAGVVYRPISDYKWVTGGRLSWFSDSVPVLTRNLYYRKENLMTGDDVKCCQQQLNTLGFPCGTADGIFGIKTRDSVISFQKKRKLDPDGVIGNKTYTALFS